MEQRIALTVNSQQYVATVSLRTLLIDLIRDEFDLTGTHVGCTYEGRCGACTVLLNGAAVKSCLVLAVQADGANILTCEGLEAIGPDQGLHPIQDGFWERHGLQCGYCTPGMLMTVFDFLDAELEREDPDLSDENIRRALVGNICRCTGYSHIVEAVQTAGERLQSMSKEHRREYFDVTRSGAQQHLTTGDGRAAIGAPGSRFR